MLIISACSKDDDKIVDCPELQFDLTSETRFYEFETDEGYTFIAWTSNPTVIAQVGEELALPFSERTMHINGRILDDESMCDLNGAWSWYFDPNDWSLSTFSMELCDGNPQYVEDHLDEYVNVIGRYCPWGSLVSREVERPD